jgi:hypothetical protein
MQQEELKTQKCMATTEDCKEVVTVKGSVLCSVHKCSYGRPTTCLMERQWPFCRCKTHKEKVGARLKQRYNESHPFSKANLLRENAELKLVVSQTSDLMRRSGCAAYLLKTGHGSQNY